MKKLDQNKEPVTIRFKELANGNKSVYLDIYMNGKRRYQFLKMYIVPETNRAAKVQNQNVMTAALAMKSQLVLDITRGIAAGDFAMPSDLLLVDAVRQYADRSMSDSYRRTIHAIARKIEKFSSKKILARRADRRYFDAFAQFLLTTMGENSVKNYMLILSVIMRRLVKQGVIQKNPMEETDKIKGTEPSRTYLTITEVKKIIDCEMTGLDEKVRRAFLFSCFCGLRYSDVVNLKWGDLTEENDKVFLDIIVVKTKTPLHVPLSDAALRWMPERGRKKDSASVFDLTCNNSCNYHLKRIAEAAGIRKNLTFHVSRHTFATLSLTAGVDIYTTSKLVGHSSVKTTQIYARIVDKKKEEAVDKIGELFD